MPASRPWPPSPPSAWTRCSPSTAGTSGRSTRLPCTSGVRIVDTRHEQTATFAAEGVRQAHPDPGSGRAHRRPRDHERRLGHHHGLVQRLATRRARRSGAAGPVGRGIVAGARPRADRLVDHEAGGHRRRRLQGGVDGARGGDRRAHAAPWARCSSTSRSTSSVRPRPSCPTPVTGRRGRTRPRVGGCSRRADRRGRAAGVHRRQRRLLGRCVGRRWRKRSRRCAFLASSTVSAGDACRPTTSWPSCAPAGC